MHEPSTAPHALPPRALGIPREALDAARTLARALAAHGETERARRMLEGCLALDPCDLESALALCDLALDRGDAGAALEAARAALSAGGGEGRAPAAALRLARALLLAGRGDEARASLLQLSTATADDVRATAARLLARLPRLSAR